MKWENIVKNGVKELGGESNWKAQTTDPFILEDNNKINMYIIF